MREWWANVYASAYCEGVSVTGVRYAHRANSVQRARQNPSRPFCRIHVRLKPEGAPRRYADDVERYAWERAERLGIAPRYA